MGLAPAAMDPFADSASTLTDGVPVFGNAAICVDSLCTTGRAGINFYFSPNPVSKVFFGASCVCGLMGARRCNRLGKYALHMGNVTSGNEIAGFMS